MLRLFDFPDPNTIVSQRSETSVASQALFFLNSAFVSAQAERFAQRLKTERRMSTSERVVLAYRLALSRPPTDDERKRNVEFLEATSNSSRWKQFCHSLFCLNEFIYVN